jgi:nitrogen fixation NifU-like protein
MTYVLIGQMMQDALLEKAKGHFSKKVIKYGIKPDRYGVISKPDGHARVSSDCGDTIEMFLRFNGGRIEEARFTSEGCLTTIAAAQAAAEMAMGKTARECLGINQSAIASYLDGLPEGSDHCAYLASLALHRALRDYAVHRKGP